MKTYEAKAGNYFEIQYTDPGQYRITKKATSYAHHEDGSITFNSDDGDGRHVHLLGLAVQVRELSKST